MFELELLAPAARFYESLGPTDQQDVERILDMILEDPFEDDQSKFPWIRGGGIGTLYDSPIFWVVYQLRGSTVRVVAIGFSHQMSHDR